jgi:hypothetical protein
VTWVKLSADAPNSTVTLAAAGNLSFTGVANTTYLVEVIGVARSAATTTGMALAFDIPSGSVAFSMIHPVSASALGSTEQIADNATTGATTGVRAAAVDLPIRGKGIIVIGATGGTVQLGLRSEVTASEVRLLANRTALGRRVI